jgi:hypothetical protein
MVTLSICDLYARARPTPSKLYAVGASLPPRSQRSARGQLMLDIIYILIGAVFLGGAILYAFGCEHL